MLKFKKCPYDPYGNRRRSNILSNVGEISSHLNRFYWKIPRFNSIRKEEDLFLHSPKFFIMNYNHLLSLQPYGKNPSESGKHQLMVGISGHLTHLHRGENSADEEHAFREYDVRFGITGRNTELSKFDIPFKCSRNCTLFSYRPKFTAALLDRLELDRENEQWLPYGNLSLFIEVKAKSGETVSSNLSTEVGFKKLQENFLDILKNGTVSDVVLRVDNRNFSSHRCVLAARSPVFLAMMTHETKEKDSGVVDIQDVDPDIFSDFLKYLYTGCLDDTTIENAVKLYIVADRYQVYELKNLCLDHMLKNMSINNFCGLYELSLLYEEKDLTDACSKFFIKSSLDIVKTPQWETFLSENPIAGNELYMKKLSVRDSL